jgi:hypothetical protein
LIIGVMGFICIPQRKAGESTSEDNLTESSRVVKWKSCQKR